LRDYSFGIPKTEIEPETHPDGTFDHSWMEAMTSDSFKHVPNVDNFGQNFCH